MKQLIGIVSVCLMASVLSFAQAPQSFKYQAIALNIEGNVISDKQISMRISLIQDSKTGQAVYSETHDLKTNQFGLISLEIGKGKNKNGEISSVNWESGNYFVNVQIDVNGGSDYVSMGVSQLLSVPYALYAETSGSVSTSSTTSNGSKEAMSWTDAGSVTYLTNPLNNAGIGTTAPVSKLHVLGTSINAVYERNANSPAGPANRFYKSRGTTASKTQVEAGDNLGQFQWLGRGDDGNYDFAATFKSQAESVRTGTLPGQGASRDGLPPSSLH